MVRYYKMRWGIEVEFRGLKQAIGNRKLRCRTGDRALTELDWAIRSMAIAELLATREQTKATRQEKDQNKYAPKERSLAQTVRALRKCLNNLDRKQDVDKGLLSELALARVQKYKNITDKKARYRPRNPHKKPLGDPEVRTMTQEERDRLKTYHPRIAG